VSGSQAERSGRSGPEKRFPEVVPSPLERRFARVGANVLRVGPPGGFADAERGERQPFLSANDHEIFLFV